MKFLMNRMALLFLATSFLSVACTKNSGRLEYGLDVKETLRINVDQEPPSLDWHKSSDTTSSTITVNTMEGLTKYDLKDPNLNLIPGLATEWTSSKNATVWTLTPRKGVKWTDGVEFTAQQVLDGWERLLNPKTASTYSYFLFNVKNAKEYNEGKITDFSQVGVKINQAGQIVVELKSPMSYFPYLLTHHSTYPIRKDVVEKGGDKWTEPENIVTLGPYKLIRWDHDKALVLERNEGYYGEKAKTKNVIAYFINEYSTALNLFNGGKLDFQHNLPTKELAQLKNDPGYNSIGILQTYYYGLNIKKKPFDNLKVRKAFAHAIDRKQVTDLLAAGMIPLSGWIPSGMSYYEPNIGLNLDVELANKLLDEAGFKDRSQFPKITIGFNTNENHQRIAENIQSQLKKNLGIDVQLANEEWKVYLDRLKTDAPSVFRMGWLADYPDPDNFMSLMTSYSDNNHTGWKNTAYDKLVEEGAATVDPAKRKAIYAKAQKILVEEDVPVIPLYTAVAQFLISSRVKNFPKTALDLIELKGVSIE